MHAVDRWALLLFISVVLPVGTTLAGEPAATPAEDAETSTADARAPDDPQAVAPENPVTSGQPATPPTPVVKAEIVVTATKRGEVSAQDVAGSITAFDSEKINRLDAVDFDEFIVQVPSTNFVDNGGPGRGHEVASIRGLSPVGDNTVSVVAQYLDGAPRTGSNYRLFDIGEISVLRGPQGTLWGSQAIGGLISYRSNRPDPSAFDAHFETDFYATGGAGGLSSRLSGYVNVPIIQDTLGLRVAAQHVTETGYIDNVTTGDDDVNDVDETAWRLSLLYRPSEKVTMTAIYHGSDLTADAPTFFNPEIGAYKSEAPFSLLPADQQYDLLNLILDVDLDWGTFNYTGSYFDLEGVYSDAELDFFGFVPAARTDTVRRQESWTHELRLSSSSAGPFNWIVGLYVDELDEFAQDETIEVADPDGSPPAIGLGQLLFFIGGPQIFKERAIFGEFSYDLSDAWQLLVGGRFFDWEVENDQDTVFLGTSFGQETGTVGDEDSFYKIQLTHFMSDDKLLYLTRSEGFRIGGFNPFVGPNWNSSLDFLKFDPDRLINYELGFKSTLADDRVLLNAAVYHMDWQDVQVVVFDSIGVFAFTANATDLDADGFELEIATQDLVARGLYAAANFTYNDNEFTEDATIFPDVGFLVERGDKLRRTPKNTWAVDLGYDFVISNSVAGYARANYWHKDATTTEGFNRGDGAVPIPAQDVVNASFGVLFGNWEAKLAIDNLTDAMPYLQVFAGASTATGSPDAERAVRVSSIRPRTVSLKLNWRW